MGVDLSEVPLAGDSKRITEADVRRYAEAREGGIVPSSKLAAGQFVKAGGRRLAIAKHMSESAHQGASVTLHADAEVGDSLSVLAGIRADPAERPSVADLVIAATANALRKHRYLNSAFLDDGIWIYDAVNIGFAVHHERGLVVPVLESADAMTLCGIAAERRRRQEVVQTRLPSPTAAQQATFTITNLGRFGIRYFTPILHSNTSGILGIGALSERRSYESPELASLPLSLTFDHRVVDGVPAAEFLMTCTELLARPNLWPTRWMEQ
jgi:pyruvate dehydrogenase E2 component (dihydrolipoamide acetyltransferase)